LDDVPLVKLWSARFFVKQLVVLWSIDVPVRFPNRFVLVSLLDAIIGEVYSAADALRKKLADEIRSKELKPWKRAIFVPLDAAMSSDNWLYRVRKLRNQGLHGSYLPENIRIGGSPPLDLRLVGYENGIVSNISLPEDFELVCQKLEELIQTSSKLIVTSLQERIGARKPANNIEDFFKSVF
jgi:23S rRNA C2498 (ribose-2'-O)-methylase RlmM